MFEYDNGMKMKTDVNLSNFKISNLKTPTNDEDAANKIYIDETLEQSHLLASSKKNEFLYLDDPDDTSSEYNKVVDGFINNFRESPHRNKKAYSITLQKDAGSNNYRSRIGFNLFPLPLGTYTLVFEFFPPEMTNIDLSVQATSAYIHKKIQKDFSSYSKMLVQINNNSKSLPDYIYLTIHGTATAAPVQGFLIVYGTKDWSDNLSPEIYDHVLTEEMFEYDDGVMKMNTDLDMAGNKFKNVSQPTVDSDVLTKRSVKIYPLRVYGIVHTGKTLVTNNNIPVGFPGSFIQSIYLLQQNKFLSQKDRIRITYLNNQGQIRNDNFPFTFSSSNARSTTVIINRLYTTTISYITTQKAFYIPFVITYNNIDI